jgi:hypothetical protein
VSDSDTQIIERKLRAAWRRQRRYFHWRGLAQALIWGITLATVDFFADWLLIFRLRWPVFWRLPLLAVNAAVLLRVLHHEWLRHLKRFDAARVALQLEGTHPELASLLISYVQLRDTDSAGLSPSLLAAMRSSALDKVRPLDFREIVDFSQLRRPAIFALCALLFCAMAGINWPRHIETLLLRMAGRNIHYPTQTRIVSVSGNLTVKQGDSVTVTAGVAGRVPPTGKVFVRLAGESAWRAFPLTAGRDAEFTRRVEAVFRDADYYFMIGDDRTAEFHVTAVPPPRLVEHRVRMTYPAYTGLKDAEADDLNIEALEGSQISWNLRCDPAVRSALLIPEGGTPIPMELQADGRELRCSLPAHSTFKYTFRLTDAVHGFTHDDVWYVARVTSDMPPDIKLLEPTSDGPATARKKTRLVIRATDDYGLSKIRLAYSVNDAEEVKQPLGTLKGRQAEAAFDWIVSTAKSDIKEGDVVTLALEVCDNREGTDSRWSRSAARRLAITSEAGYLRWLSDQLDEQRADVHRAWTDAQTSQSAIQQIKGQEAPR